MTEQIAIVTGAAAGIGLATARRFLQDGGKVLLADINEATLHDAAAQLSGAFGADNVANAVCDVSDETACAAAVAAALSAFGAVNVIVNNAGLMVFKTIETQSREDWLRVLSVDLLGAFYLTRQAFLHMGQGGAIVNVASVHAVQTEPMVAPYAAAKAALLSLTRSAALEGKPKGIRVNAVLPGAIDTPMLWDNPNVRAGIEQVDPKDVGRPEDVAAVIAFLAGADAAFMNGAAVLVDGGRLVKL
jgi:NAD(P)-dependent dehydrogenase (short-subunit alcohol dehydrogenase family)